jgi:hypothetical protein
MADYDVPWKEILDAHLSDFLELCLPQIYDGIDWAYPIESCEQELPKMFPNSLASGRVADKLFRARNKGDGLPISFMIHTEIQVSWQPDFSRRMFTCYYRILDRFDEPVVCIGILGDNSRSWRPDVWETELFDSQLRFTYPIVKLRDFADKVEDLRSSTNPFATVITSHLNAQSSANNIHDRFRFKVELVRSLYEKKWQIEQVRRLFRFIDWVMDLPEALELQFREVLNHIEMENQMPYVTSIERLAKLEGKLEGKLGGKIQLLQEILGVRVSSDSELEVLSVEQLESLFGELRRQWNKENE